VPHVLIMAAFELGDPMPLVILVEAHDAPLHDPFVQRYRYDTYSGTARSRGQDSGNGGSGSQ
jgi:hypothetical protein